MTSSSPNADGALPQTAVPEETTVLYVDADPAVRETTRAGIERRRAELSVVGVGDVSGALEVLDALIIDCLVVDPGGLSTVEALLDAVDCPVLLYTSLPGEDLPASLTDRARTHVRKSAVADGAAFLAEKIHSVVGGLPDRTDAARTAALEKIRAGADDEIAVVLAPDGTVQWASRELSTLLPAGGEPDSLLDRLAAITPDTDAVRERLARLRAGSTRPETLPVAGEADRYLLVRGHEAPDGTGDGRLLLLSEVTAQARRIVQREQLSLLVERARDGLYTLDEDGVIDFCNDAFAETLGYDREALIGTHAEATLAPGELARGQQTIERLLNDPDSHETTVELRFQRADGTDRLLSIRYTLLLGPDGTYEGLMGAVRDVTERHERERSLRRQHELFDSLVRNFPNGGVFLFDGNLRFTQAGGEELADVGLDPDEMIGRTPSEVFPPENARVLEEHYRAALDGEQSAFEDTYQDRRYHVQTIPIPDGTGTPVAGMAVAQNVTEQRERQWELERTNTLLSTLLDSLPVGIVVENSDREITTVNQRFLDMFGLLGRPVDVVGQDCVIQARRVSDQFVDQRAFVEGVDSVPEDHPARHDQELELRDGRVFQRSAVPVSLPEGRGTIWLYRDVTDRVEDERELQETTERLDMALEGAELAIWDWDIGTGSVTRNDRWAEMLGYDPETVEPTLEAWAQRLHPDDRERAEAALQAHVEGETDYYQCDVRLRTSDGDYRWIRDSGKIFERDAQGQPVRAVGIHQDITERKEGKRELERQRDDLEMLARTHSLIQDVIRVLGEAASREEIEEIVCRRLVESSLYQFAWLGEREGGDERLATRTAAGGDADAVALGRRADDGEPSPETAAVTTGEVQLLRDITDGELPDAWREAALKRGYRSAVAIPLVHGDVVHGVLAVYANRPDVFSDRAVESFAVLGEMIGFALAAVQNRRLLAHDTVLQLTYRCPDDGLFVPVARELDCQIEIDGSVDVDDGSLQYLSITDGSPGAVLQALRDRSGELDGRVVRDEGGSGVVELSTTWSFESSLLDVGARPLGIEIDGEGLVVTTEAPADADPRTVREALSGHAPAFELTAKRERERSPDEPTADADTRARLTDRQLEILQAAYLAGYYAWPRDTTAEQLAETLDIASPTLHQHLRRAQRNLLASLFDD